MHLEVCEAYQQEAIDQAGILEAHRNGHEHRCRMVQASLGHADLLSLAGNNVLPDLKRWV